MLSTKIQALRRSLQLNQVEFAERLGVTQGTVARWENGAMPRGDVLVRLAVMAGIPLQDFIGADFEGAPPDSRLMVKGEVAAGVWREAWQWEPDDWSPYYGGAHVNAPQERRFGLIVHGESMNEIYPPGTILDCVHLIGGFEDLRDGQNVIVVRKRYGDGVEATVKQFRHDGERMWLVPRSTNPAFQAPIELGNEEPDIEDTAVIAVVRGSYRPE